MAIFHAWQRNTFLDTIVWLRLLSESTRQFCQKDQKKTDHRNSIQRILFDGKSFLGPVILPTTLLSKLTSSCSQCRCLVCSLNCLIHCRFVRHHPTYLTKFTRCQFNNRPTRHRKKTYSRDRRRRKLVILKCVLFDSSFPMSNLFARRVSIPSRITIAYRIHAFQYLSPYTNFNRDFHSSVIPNDDHTTERKFVCRCVFGVCNNL